MKYFYDRKHDSLSITLVDRRYDTSEEVWPGVVVDFDPEGRPIAFEFGENASAFVDVEALAQDRSARVVAPERLRSTTDVDGREIRLRREGLGLTQAQLADALGVSSNTVARWERGEMKIDNPRLLSLAMAALVGAKAPATANSSKRRGIKPMMNMASGFRSKPSVGQKVFVGRSARAASSKSSKRK